MAMKDNDCRLFLRPKFSTQFEIITALLPKQQRDKKYRLTIRRFSHYKNAVSNLLQLFVATLQKWRPFIIKHPRINFDLNFQLMAALHRTD